MTRSSLMRKSIPSTVSQSQKDSFSFYFWIPFIPQPSLGPGIHIHGVSSYGSGHNILNALVCLHLSVIVYWPNDLSVRQRCLSVSEDQVRCNGRLGGFASTLRDHPSF